MIEKCTIEDKTHTGEDTRFDLLGNIYHETLIGDADQTDARYPSSVAQTKYFFEIIFSRKGK